MLNLNADDFLVTLSIRFSGRGSVSAHSAGYYSESEIQGGDLLRIMAVAQTSRLVARRYKLEAGCAPLALGGRRQRRSLAEIFAVTAAHRWRPDEWPTVGA
ncbi:hypothetical protein ACNKHP_03085 [Shigella boydii]